MKTFNYTPPKSLAPFFASNARVRLIRGPIGSLKSTACTMELFRRSCQQAPDGDGIRRTRFAIVRNTLPQIRETCLVTARKALGPLIRYKVSESKVILKFNDVESEWLLLPLDTPDNVQRLLSLELTGAWVSEFREMDPAIVKDIYSRCGRFPATLGQGSRPTWYGLIGETNSFSEDSPWFDLLEINKPASWYYLVQPGAYDEGADWHQYHEPHYYTDLLENNGEAWAEQYIHNRITPSLSSQAVFAKTFRQDAHVVPGLIYNPNSPLVLGLDTGRHPAAVMGQLSPSGRLNILGSLAQENTGMAKFLQTQVIPYIHERFPRAYCYAIVDPAGRQRSQIGEQSVLDAIKECGIPAYPAQTNAIAPRLRAVEKFLMRLDGLAIDPEHNKDLIIGFRFGYRFAREKSLALKEIPEKSIPYSDLCDAAQYLALGIENPMIGRMAANRRRPVQTREPSSAGWT